MGPIIITIYSNKYCRTKTTQHYGKILLPEPDPEYFVCVGVLLSQLGLPLSVTIVSVEAFHCGQPIVGMQY